MNKQIRECIKLLHKDYRSGYKLNLFYTRLQFIIWLINYPSKSKWFELINVLRKRIFGSYDDETDTINIYIFNFDKKDKLHKFNIISTLYHEIRHYYQQHYMYNKFKHDIENYIPCGKDGYEDQQIELDAYNFSTRMLNRHLDKLNEIMDKDINWLNEMRLKFKNKNI